MSASGGAKIVSETARERETFKYNPYALTDCRINESGNPIPSSELSTATDSILTALAQLGVFQTGTQRAFISLFDEKYQYIVAEASPLTPLIPGLSGDKCPEPLLHCGTAIPRNLGLCEHVVFAPPDSDTAQRPAAEEYANEGAQETGSMAVPDVIADPRFSSRAFCPYSKSCRFYAAVPIRTPKGIDIGAYCVINPTQPDAWGSHSLSRLKDVSRAIMDHLEATRSAYAYRRNQRVTRGMGSFIEGKTTLSGWQSGPNVAAFADDARLEGALDPQQQDLEHRDQALVGGTTPPRSWSSKFSERHTGDSTPRRSTQSQLTSNSPIRPTAFGQFDPGDSDHESTERIFSKAANLLRESFEVAGCFFFDVTMGSYRPSTVADSQSEQQDTDKGTSNQSSTGSSDENLPTSSREEPESACSLLGFSTADASSINDAEVGETDKHITKTFLAKLLRRYPDGKIFNFNTAGELQSSDSSDDATIQLPVQKLEDAGKAANTRRGTRTAARERQQSRRFDSLKEGALIHQAFPTARSVAFVPVWDSKRERWFAGGFVYTSTRTRIFTLRDELSFFTAFSKLIAAEVHTLDALRANKAKSDILGSLSHELRSPLHGIILGSELLNDTRLSVFQANATHTIETCSRTLLDTVDHLLEYSKVNTYGAQRRLETKATSPQMRKKERLVHFSNKTLYSNTSVDVLVEEVADSIFAGFNFQHMSVGNLSKQTRSQSADTAGHNSMDSKQAMEQLGLGSQRETGTASSFGNVSVDLCIDSSCDWVFYTQAGAIRRLVMNLLGNSLKYTVKGFIRVSLTQDPAGSRHLKTGRMVRLVVQDTGQGISEDYLQHKLYRPFAQENELAAGTGLGLSLVKSIVSQLRGKIQVESELGTGTTFTVTLPLEQPSKSAAAATRNEAEDSENFEDQLKSISGLRIQMKGFEPVETVSPDWNRRATVEDICRDWLHMSLVPDDHTEQMAPDIILWSNDAIPESFGHDAKLARTPNVVVCQNALESYQRYRACEGTGQEGTFEFITQPIGPRKLAKSFQLAYKRWTGLPRSDLSPHTSVGHQLPNQIKMTVKGQTGSSSDKPGADTTAAHPDSSSQEPETVPEVDNDVGGFKMLLVDDNAINLRMLSAYMAKLGREFEKAVNGKEAYEKYINNPRDFAGILMDISMPVMDGLEATRRIRVYARQNHIRAVSIIALTGLSSESAQQEALESGVDIFLTKPVKFKALSEVLESMNLLTKGTSEG